MIESMNICIGTDLEIDGEGNYLINEFLGAKKYWNFSKCLV